MQSPIPRPGQGGWTAVLRATEAGHADVVEELVVRHGADVSARNSENNMDAEALAREKGHRGVLAVLTAAAAARAI